MDQNIHFLFWQLRTRPTDLPTSPDQNAATDWTKVSIWQIHTASWRSWEAEPMSQLGVCPAVRTSSFELVCQTWVRSATCQ